MGVSPGGWRSLCRRKTWFARPIRVPGASNSAPLRDGTLTFFEKAVKSELADCYLGPADPSHHRTTRVDGEDGRRIARSQHLLVHILQPERHRRPEPRPRPLRRTPSGRQARQGRRRIDRTETDAVVAETHRAARLVHALLRRRRAVERGRAVPLARRVRVGGLGPVRRRRSRRVVPLPGARHPAPVRVRVRLHPSERRADASRGIPARHLLLPLRPTHDRAPARTGVHRRIHRRDVSPRRMEPIKMAPRPVGSEQTRSRGGRRGFHPAARVHRGRQVGCGRVDKRVLRRRGCVRVGGG